MAAKKKTSPQTQMITASVMAVLQHHNLDDLFRGRAVSQGSFASILARPCANWIRELARQQGAWANIPPKRNRKDPICFSPYLYRARNLIERFFNKIKQCRRVATRYDKLAANYLAFVKLASFRIWLRANESTA
jgi:transposase